MKGGGVPTSGVWQSTAFVVGCGCLIALLTYGLRTSFGLFAAPIGEGRGWSPEVFALAMEQTGSFLPVWWAGIALAVIAAGLRWPIVERPAPGFAASARAEG